MRAPWAKGTFCHSNFTPLLLRFLFFHISELSPLYFVEEADPEGFSHNQESASKRGRVLHLLVTALDRHDWGQGHQHPGHPHVPEASQATLFQGVSSGSEPG